MRGKPALGCAMTRARSCGASSPTSGANSVGPSEQLSPTAEAPSADSVVALLANGIGFSIKRDDMGFVRISAPVGTPLHIVDGLRNMLLAFQGAAPDRIEIAESDDISVQSFIDGEGAIPTLNECHRALCEAIGRIR